jgi:hypothetical protein
MDVRNGRKKKLNACYEEVKKRIPSKSELFLK